MTTHGASYQITYCNGPPVAIAPNNTFAIDVLTNILYICENGVWLQLSGGGGAVGANPTAVAGPAAINGVAVTYMRSDAAPAIQLATNGQFGIVKPDGVTITIAAGVISAVVPSGTLTAGTTGTSGFAVGDLIVNDTGNVINPVADVAIHQVLVSGGVGAKPAYSATPIVTSIQFGSGTVLNDYEEGTWTPTDASGASLSISNNRSTYTKIGRQVTLQMNVNYPGNANGSASKIGGLPFSIPTAVVLGDPLTLNATVDYAYTSSSGTTFNILTAAGAPVLNSALNNSIVQGNIFYPNT